MDGAGAVVIFGYADAAPAGGRRRIRRALEFAEMSFVTRVVDDGGIGPWRESTEQRFLAARQAFADRRRLARADTAALIVALVDVRTRDGCWVLVESHPDPAWVGFWQYLVSRALPPYRSEPLFLLAWSSWRAREVTLARSAVESALAEDPAHVAASMLRTMLHDGIDPARIPSLADRRDAR